jgi:hypothetical protein
VNAGHLTCEKVGASRRYQRGSIISAPQKSRKDVGVNDLKPIGMPVQPGRYNINAAPNYQPEAGPHIRAGAQDFKRIPSVGYAC